MKNEKSEVGYVLTLWDDEHRHVLHSVNTPEKNQH